MWGIRVRTQVFKRESHTQIHLNWIIVEFLFCIKKKKEKREFKILKSNQNYGYFIFKYIYIMGIWFSKKILWEFENF